MGWIVHDAIVVTSWKDTLIREAHEKAKSLMPHVTDIVMGTANRYESFLIAPDGSKEGWEESAKGEMARAQFLAWVDEQAHEDGSNSIVYACVRFGEIEPSITSNAQ